METRNVAMAVRNRRDGVRLASCPRGIDYAARAMQLRLIYAKLHRNAFPVQTQMLFCISMCDIGCVVTSKS